MRRERDSRLGCLLVLLMAAFCSSCGLTYSHKITPSIDLSNIENVKNGKKKPLKVAVLIPNRLKGHIFDAIEKDRPIHHPIKLGDSTAELFESGLKKLFEDVDIIYEPTTKNVDKFPLVFKIEDIVNENVSREPWKDIANIGYEVNVYSPMNTYNKTFTVRGYGEREDRWFYGLAAFPFDLSVVMLSAFTLGFSEYIYGLNTMTTQDYAKAFARAQESAFGYLISTLNYDSKFTAVVSEEVERLAAKCNLTTSPSFADQHAFIPNNVLDAADTGEVVCKISNTGEGAGFGVQLKITSKNSHTSIASEYEVGEIPPHGTKEVRIPISADLGVEDGFSELYIETKEKRGYDAPPVKLKIQTARLEKPELSIASVEINDSNRGQAKGNGNGIPENEETVELVAFIKNSGEGPGRKVRLSLEEINSQVEVIQKTQEIGTVNAGEIVKGAVVIRIPRTFNEKKLEYRLKVADARQGAAQDEKRFVLNLGLLKPVLAYNFSVKDGGYPGTSGNGNSQVENGEKIALIITPRNNGTAVAKDVSLAIEPPRGISADRQRVNIGSLIQGKDGQPVEFMLSVPRTYDGNAINIPLHFSQTDFEGMDDRIDIPVRQVKPKLELARFSLNGIQDNTTLGKNQEAELEVFIKNSGELPAEGLTVTLSHNEKGVVLKEENRTIRYGTLQPGMESEALRFPLFIQQSAAVGPMPVQISISQADFPGKTEPLQLAIQEGAVQEVVVKGEKLKSPRPYISPAANFPPEIIIDAPFDGEHLSEPELTLQFRVSADEEIRKVDISVNGINQVRGVDLEPKSESERRQLRRRKNITLAEGDNVIQITAYDNRNERTDKSVTVHYSKELGLGRTFAIIIGIADYQNNGIQKLNYTENDAAAVRDFLMSNEGGRVPMENIKFLTGRDATTENIKSAIGDWLPVKANRKNDRVLLFFAGHGVKRGGEGYFLAYNTDPERMVGTSVDMQDITKYLYNVEAKTVIFISDACHSGAAFAQKQIAARGDRMDGSFLIHQFSGEGRITMVAAKSGQESIELSEFGHGLFTYYLLRGLEGEADKKGNGDKKVDIQELYRYIYDQVSNEASKRNFSQSPQMDSQVEGDIIMAIVP